MTTAKNGTSHTRTRIQQFTSTKQTEFFESIKEAKFSGQLVVSDEKPSANPALSKNIGESERISWTIYLYLGRIIYGTGGVHPVRRWRRHLVAYCPERLADFDKIQSELAAVQEEECRVSWEYKLLSVWIEQKKISPEQANKIINATVIEVLFDITQAMEVVCETVQDNLLSTRLVLIEADQVISESNKLWQAWQAAKIADRSPDMAPVIRQPEALKKRTSPQIYQNLSQLLDGKQSLRDLSIRMKRDVVTVTRSLLPYVQLGLVQLVAIDDIAPPVSAPVAQRLSKNIAPHRTLIACIDDSPAICQTMEQVITSAGYQFVAEMDGLRAIAILLSRKPDLIFLDLVMPNTNGYEICTQLRKLSFFKNTPIVIVTGNDGIIDRVRARMVGATDFLSKPVNQEILLNIIDKYIKQKKQQNT